MIQYLRRVNNIYPYVFLAWVVLVILSFFKDYYFIIEYHEVPVTAIYLLVRSLISWSIIVVFIVFVYNYSLDYPIRSGKITNAKYHIPVFFLSILFIAGWFTLVYYGTRAFFKTSNFPEAYNIEVVYGSYFRSLVLTLPFLYALVIIFQWYLDTYSEIVEKETSLINSKSESIKSKLDTLKSKINPHFLFNILQGINTLSYTDKSTALEMLRALKKLFKKIYDESDDFTTTLAEEISFSENYLFLEKMRFKKRLNFVFNIKKNCEDFNIPKFILQPLIENSVKHLLSKTTNSVTIRIECYMGEGNLIMQVEDSGYQGKEYKEMINDLKAGNFGFGLTNLKKRLLVFSREADLCFCKSNLGGLKTCISIPITEF